MSETVKNIRFLTSTKDACIIYGTYWV